jgi:hypothetical protein
MNVEMNSWQLVRKLPWPKDRRYPWLKVPTPTIRALQVCAFDPSTGGYAGNSTTVHVPREKLAPGPSGRKIGVVDYDAANKRYYPPVDLDDPLLLANDGLDPTESDPRFHKRWSMRALPELSRCSRRHWDVTFIGAGCGQT